MTMIAQLLKLSLLGALIWTATGCQSRSATPAVAAPEAPADKVEMISIGAQAIPVSGFEPTVSTSDPGLR